MAVDLKAAALDYAGWNAPVMLVERRVNGARRCDSHMSAGHDHPGESL